MRVLILNHTNKECGVYQFAKRVYSIASKSKDVEYLYEDVPNRCKYYELLGLKPDYIIYNWHWDRMPWLKEEDVTLNTQTKHYFIYHDGSKFNVYDKYLFFGDYDPKRNEVSEDKRVLLPRPLLDYYSGYPVNDVPTIGSFGFATDHKRFPELVSLVNHTFDKAVINLHMTSPYFGVTPGYNLPKIVRECRYRNTNKNVKLNITTNFLDDNGLLTFLAMNDINAFYYSPVQNPGISSALDYALSVTRPIGITNNMTFRHIYSDEISMDIHSIKDILSHGTKPLQTYYYAWSTSNFMTEMDNLFK